MARIEAISFPGWTGGLNKEADPAQVAADELIEALNVSLGLGGSISRRPGYTASLSVSNPIEGMALWDEGDSTRWYVYVVDTASNINLYASSSPSASGTSQSTDWVDATNRIDYWFAMASLDEKLFVTSRRSATTNFAYYWDGTSWTAVTDRTLDGSGTEFPQAAALVSAHNRMFAFNCEVNSGTFRSRMYYSNAGDPLTWASTDFIDFNPDDGQQITGAALLGESIVVFKDRSMHLLSGVSDDTFTVYPIDTRVGTTAPGTIVVDGGVLRFFDPNTGVWAFDGSEFDKLDDKINEYLLDGVSSANVHKAHAFMWDNKYCLSVPWGDSYNSRTFVYDPRLSAWVEWDFGVQHTWTDGRSTYLGSAVSDGAASLTLGIYEFDSGYDDGGNDYTSTARTGWISPSGGGLKHRLRRLDGSFSALGDYDLTMNLYRNFGLQTYVTHTVNLNPGGFIWGTSLWGEEEWGTGIDQVFLRQGGWEGRWRWASLEFEMTGQDNQFQVNRLVAYISTIGSLREPTELTN